MKTFLVHISYDLISVTGTSAGCGDFSTILKLSKPEEWSDAINVIKASALDKAKRETPLIKGVVIRNISAIPW